MSEDFRFFFGAASGSQRKALQKLEEPNVMISYATKHNTPWYGIENLIIDSGGYTLMLREGEHDPPENYLEYISKVDPDWYVLPDYPCEPDILEKYGRSVEDHQELTSQQHRKTMELADSIGIDAEPVSVIQGWTEREYLDHLDRLRESGLLTDYVGVGSICRRHSRGKIQGILKSIAAEIPDRKIHAFGVKTTILRDAGVVEAIDSADSLAYAYACQMEQETDQSWTNVARHYLQFKQKIESTVRQPERPEIPLSHYE